MTSLREPLWIFSSHFFNRRMFFIKLQCISLSLMYILRRYESSMCENILLILTLRIGQIYIVSKETVNSPKKLLFFPFFIVKNNPCMVTTTS